MNLFRTSRLFVLAISMVTLLLAGCGDSNEDFVITGNNPNAGVGNLVFQFVRPQAAVVPATTTTLDFEFFNTVDPELGTLVYEAESVFANTVTVVNVPVSARSVVITALDANDIPVGTLTATVEVIGANTVNVNLAGAVFTAVTFDSIFVDPNPVNLSLGANPGATAQVEIIGSFSNGDELVFDTASYATAGTFGVNNVEVATVSTGGVVTAVGNGASVLDVTFTVNGVTRFVEVPVNVSTFVVGTNGFDVLVGTTSEPVVATFNFNGGAGVDVTTSPDTTYGSNNPDVVANDDGTVTVDADAVNGETATITATYDNDGVDMVDTYVVTVIENV